jgi:hypothetical protein
VSRTFNHAVSKCQGTVESTFEQPELAESSFLFWQRSEVRHQVHYIVWLDLGTESRHLPFALGDYFAQRLIALLLNLLGAQILGVERLAGRTVSTAIG